MNRKLAARGGPSAVLLVTLALARCGGQIEEQARHWTGGDPSSGRQAIRRYGCTSCHTIPGVRGADGLVGPPLNRIASRVYIAGGTPNTPENMMSFLAHPHGHHPGTAMPEMPLPKKEIRDIAAYLFTLR